MAEPFLSEIRMFGFGWPPRGWAECDGQILPINQNQSLYSLLGTTYGGDGRTSFALPDLRSRTPVGMDASLHQGQREGVENVTLTDANIPVHRHAVNATTEAGTTKSFDGNILASAVDSGSPTDYYAEPQNLVSFASQSVSYIGGSMSHSNEQPSLVVNFCIAMQGLFPSRN